MTITDIKKKFSTEGILFLISLIGIGGGIYMVIAEGKKMPVGKPVIKPLVPVYKKYIAAAGIVESKDSNISVATFVPGVVQKIEVNPGDFVKKGDVLFVLDERQAKDNLEIQRMALESAKALLDQAQYNLNKTKHLYDRVKNLSNKDAISGEEMMSRHDDLQIARASLKVAQAGLKSAKAFFLAAQTNLEVLTVRAPIEGEILQINMDVGEFISADTSFVPVLMGNSSTRQIRIEIDENDAWKFKPGASAIASLRGHTDQKTELVYSYTEPYVVPKLQLTGMPQAKVDVRVLQVVYTYDPTALPSYIGQQLDVYIEVLDDGHKQ